MNSSEMTENGKHIVFVNHSRELHGSEQVMIETLRQCRAQGWRVTMVLPINQPDGGLAQVVEKYAEVIYLNYKNMGDGSFRTMAVQIYNLSAVVRLIRWIRKNQVDLIYSNTSVILLGAIAARWLHIPHIWHWHEVPSKEFGSSIVSTWLLRYWQKYSERILFISKTQKELWEKAFSNHPIDNAHVIYNPTRTIQIPKTEHEGSIRIGYVGSFQERKNLSWLVQTVAQLAGKYDIRLLIYGAKDQTEKDKIQALWQDSQDRMTVGEFTEDVASVYAGLDIFVLPSWSETMPLVVLEAMQAGVCVIQTDRSGMNEIMQDGRECLFVDPDKKESLRDALIRCMEPTFRSELATRGKTFANQWMEQNNYQRNIMAVFKSLLEK